MSIPVKSTHRTAVVILNWNGEQMLRRFLPSVLRHSAGAADVIVADNGSTDESLAVLAAEFPSVRVLALEENYGFAEGYNRALAQVEAEYYVLLNSDVEVTEGWLAPLTDYLDTHADVAAVQPKLLDWNKRDYFEYAGAAGGYLDRYGYPFCRGRIFSTVERDHGQYDTPCRVLWASGAALMIRRRDWLETGGLDGCFFAHMEEIDLCWRLRSRGRGIACVPQSCVYHVGGGTLNAGSPHKTYLNFRNNLLMLYKNLPAAELRPVLRVRAFLDWVAALKMLFTDGAAHALSILRARRDFRRLKGAYKSVREENLRRATGEPVAERTDRCLLLDYHLHHRRLFSELDRP